MEAYEKPSVLRTPTYYRGLFVDESGRDAPHGGLREAAGDVDAAGAGHEADASRRAQTTRHRGVQLVRTVSHQRARRNQDIRKWTGK